MSRFAYVLIAFTLMVSLITAFFGLLPNSPFSDVITELIVFIQSDSVAQGLRWLAWFFPIGNVVTWIPAIINAMLAYFGARLSLMVLNIM